MFSEALHEDLMRIGLAPNKSLANVRKMPPKRPQNQAVLQGTRIVRFPEFYEKVVRVFWSIADAIRAMPDKDVFVFVHPKKSNEWLAVLFVDFLKRTGMAALVPRVLFTVDPSETFDAFVIFLDDATYSGQQMADYLEYFLPDVTNSLVIVGVPFATKVALGVIRKELEKHSGRLASMILYADVIEPLYAGMKPAIYFDHKVPDDVSTYATYDRYLDPAKVRPFYKNDAFDPNRSLKQRPTVSLNASVIAPARMVTVLQDPSRTRKNQQNNRPLVTYDNLY